MSNTIPKQQAAVLVVEDNDIDVEAVQRAFKKGGITNPIYTASDGVDALDMLHGRNSKGKVPQPYIILLDINMPRMDGIALLKELRHDEALKPSVVFMLTTSAREIDRQVAYDNNVAGYFLKDDLCNLTKMLDGYCAGNEFPAVVF